MPRRTIELDQEPADRGRDQRGAKRPRQVAREREGSGIVAAMGGEQLFRPLEYPPIRRRDVVAAMLAGDEEAWRRASHDQGSSGSLAKTSRVPSLQARLKASK